MPRRIDINYGTRIFNGKKYLYADSFRNKKEAESKANSIRRKFGWKARITKSAEWGYVVWASSK